MKKERATILVITVWILALLSAIALSITYRTRIQFKLVANELSRVKAYYIAKAGIIQALAIMNQDTSSYNSLIQKWSNYSAALYGINNLKDIAVGEGTFSVHYVYDKDIFSGAQNIFSGMEDEERKININKAAQDVLESLPGVTPQIALSIRAWRGDETLTEDVKFSEDTYYQGLTPAYKRKGKPFNCLSELTLVRGITPEMLYGKDLNNDLIIDVNESGLIKYLTVFGDGLVNINTANLAVLRAIGFSEDLSYRILRYRLGYDEILGTGDDGYFTDVNQIAAQLSAYEPLMPEETKLIDEKKSMLKVASRFYKIQSQATIPNQANCTITAVVDKESEEGNQIISWGE